MKRYAVLATTLFLLMLVNSPASADSSVPPHDYTLDVGEEFVFVMLTISDDTNPYSQGGEMEDPEIRAKYSQSGLYHIDDSDNPIWIVDWYAFSVDISSDGKHLVRWGPWALIGDYDEIAVEFYENGKLLISYRVNDLVAKPRRLPHSVSHFTWAAEIEFDKEKNELFVRTEHGEKYLFDVTTGKVIEGTLPKNRAEESESGNQAYAWDPRLTYVLLGLCLCGLFLATILVIAGGYFLWKKRNQSV